ncbi:helix-turn-helix domain-containing protein [Prescottella equi]|nr:helix-turn-helix domain-containing protein [Prescottella equi]
MATPTFTPDAEATIREGNAAGRSLRSIARELDVNPSAVSRWSKKRGLIWTGVPHAADVVRKRLEYNRMLLAEAALADALAIRERLWEEHTVIVSTPAGPQHVTLDLPDAKAVADYAGAIEKLVRTHDVMSQFTVSNAADHAKSMLGQLQAAITALVEEESEEPPTPTDEELNAGLADVTAE